MICWFAIPPAVDFNWSIEFSQVLVPYRDTENSSQWEAALQLFSVAVVAAKKSGEAVCLVHRDSPRGLAGPLQIDRLTEPAPRGICEETPGLYQRS